ncbi:MAG: hypothetical protein ACREA4_13515, partial [Nitrososphaera sp.]
CGKTLGLQAGSFRRPKFESNFGGMKVFIYFPALFIRMFESDYGKIERITAIRVSLDSPKTIYITKSHIM